MYEDTCVLVLLMCPYTTSSEEGFLVYLQRSGGEMLVHTVQIFMYTLQMAQRLRVGVQPNSPMLQREDSTVRTSGIQIWIDDAPEIQRERERERERERALIRV